MVSIGKQAGRSVTAVLSNMDEPLGEMIGNALEVKEAIDTLHGRGPSDLKELVKTLAAEALLTSCNRKITQQDAFAKVEKVISSGEAFKTFVEMVKIQGGDSEMVKNPALLPTAKEVVSLKSKEAGHISRIDCEEIGLAAMMLGAGRENKDSVIDLSVGLRLVKHVGDKVEKGESLAELHVDAKRNNQKAMDRLQSAFHFSKDPVNPQPLILDIVS